MGAIWTREFSYSSVARDGKWRTAGVSVFHVMVALLFIIPDSR